ncbi:hypothetical protein RRF57_003569 [Xylaria bambusicola]|uniref:Uncharacterized protein n=1 Tax=Xylaria bambusicola TaxID=326684 RepID=A0AAN7UKY2_9PEZI
MALDCSVFYYEILNFPNYARRLAKATDDAIAELILSLRSLTVTPCSPCDYSMITCPFGRLLGEPGRQIDVSEKSEAHLKHNQMEDGRFLEQPRVAFSWAW